MRTKGKHQKQRERERVDRSLYGLQRVMMGAAAAALLERRKRGREGRMEIRLWVVSVTLEQQASSPVVPRILRFTLPLPLSLRRVMVCLFTGHRSGRQRQEVQRRRARRRAQSACDSRSKGRCMEEHCSSTTARYPDVGCRARHSGKEKGRSEGNDAGIWTTAAARTGMTLASRE